MVRFLGAWGALPCCIFRDLCFPLSALLWLPGLPPHHTRTLGVEGCTTHTYWTDGHMNGSGPAGSGPRDLWAEVHTSQVQRKELKRQRLLLAQCRGTVSQPQKQMVHWIPAAPNLRASEIPEWPGRREDAGERQPPSGPHDVDFTEKRCSTTWDISRSYAPC